MRALLFVTLVASMGTGCASAQYDQQEHAAIKHAIQSGDTESLDRLLSKDFARPDNSSYYLDAVSGSGETTLFRFGNPGECSGTEALRLLLRRNAAVKSSHLNQSLRAGCEEQIKLLSQRIDPVDALWALNGWFHNKFENCDRGDDCVLCSDLQHSVVTGSLFLTNISLMRALCDKSDADACKSLDKWEKISALFDRKSAEAVQAKIEAKKKREEIDQTRKEEEERRNRPEGLLAAVCKQYLYIRGVNDEIKYEHEVGQESGYVAADFLYKMGQESIAGQEYLNTVEKNYRDEIGQNADLHKCDQKAKLDEKEDQAKEAAKTENSQIESEICMASTKIKEMSKWFSRERKIAAVSGAENKQSLHDSIWVIKHQKESSVHYQKLYRIKNGREFNAANCK